MTDGFMNHNSPKERPLAGYVQHELSEAQLTRMWENVEQRTRHARLARQQRRVMAWGVAAVAAGVLLGWMVKVPFLDEALSRHAFWNNGDQVHLDGGEGVTVSTPLTQGTSVAAQDETMSLDLMDGSELKLSPQSRVSLHTSRPDEVRLALEQGKVICNVSKNEERNFFVLAGSVVVRVVGTRFSVNRSLSGQTEEVAVSVERGVVEVTTSDGVVKRLSQGEAWSVRVNSAASEQEESVEAEAEALEPSQHPSEQQPETAASLEKSDAQEARGRAPAASAGSVTARDDFEAARLARREGNAARAAQLYERFVTNHGSDPRAGVAALELGRLKMDQLGDAAGAIQWLNRAAALGAGGLGDDALARLVMAHDQLGHRGTCQSLKERYLSNYKKGVHRARVERSCP